MIDTIGPALGITIAVVVTAVLFLLARLDPTKPARDLSAGRHRSALPTGRESAMPEPAAQVSMVRPLHRAAGRRSPAGGHS